jgi:hypothetical protein
MKSLKEELTDMKIRKYHWEVHGTVDVVIKDVLQVIEKRIDSIMQREITDSHHFEIQQMKNDLNTTDAIVRICREIKGLLNES